MRTVRVIFSQILILIVLFFSSCDNNTPLTPEPSVSFTMDRSDGRVDEIITFTNTSQYATSYEWDFGDGNSSTEENPSHAYSSHGVFTITLVANGEGGSGSNGRLMIVWDLVLESTFYGDSVKFQGPTEFKAQPVKFVFYNKSLYKAAAGMVLISEGYSHQDVLNRFENGVSELHHASWTDIVDGVWKEIKPNESHTWVGYLDPGLYSLTSCRNMPFLAWYVASLTVNIE